MTRQERKLFNALRKLGAPVIERPEGDRDGAFILSAEDNMDFVWADYWYPEYGLFGVATIVTDTAEEHGFHAEWINPGIVGFYQ